MKCNHVREYLFAFLDNELDAPLSIHLQRHLEHCHVCAREVEIERTIRRKLTETLEAGPVDSAQDERDLRRVVTCVATRPSRLAIFARPLTVAASVGLVFVVATATWFGLRDRAGETPVRLFADLLVSDFQHFLAEGAPLQLASADPALVRRWLGDETGLNIPEPLPVGPHCRLIGARRCKLNGRAAAFVLYDMGGQPASLVVVERDAAGLTQMERIGQGEGGRWVDRCKGHTVVIWPRGELVYAAVAKLPEQELIRLVLGAEHESD